VDKVYRTRVTSNCSGVDQSNSGVGEGDDLEELHAVRCASFYCLKLIVSGQEGKTDNE
jgi:hypothetical protein